jgi:hypothetical protein
MPLRSPIALTLAAAFAAAAANAASVLVLKGTVVTMDEKGTVLQSCGVVIKNGLIDSVLAAGQAPPAGATVVDTKGRIYPGLINLHNHIAYNFLPLYPVPGHYDNRDEWPGGALYERLVNNPKTIVTDPGLFDRQAEALKYAEIKAIVGGETTVQGSPQDAATSTSLVRNVELPNFDKDLVGQRGLPIDGLFLKDLAANQKSIAKLDAWLFHLSEGISDHSRREYFNAAYDASKNPTSGERGPDMTDWLVFKLKEGASGGGELDESALDYLQGDTARIRSAAQNAIKGVKLELSVGETGVRISEATASQAAQVARAVEKSMGGRVGVAQVSTNEWWERDDFESVRVPIG